jgi:hypothetical protein
MSQKYYFGIIVIFFVIVITSCNNSQMISHKVEKKKYYSSGALYSRGFYIRDTIPVDTLIIYHEGGLVAHKKYYNEKGKFVSLTNYIYRNGKLRFIVATEDGLSQGFNYLFNDNGNLEVKSMFYKDKQKGDCFFYDIEGRVKSYIFNWDSANVVINIDYNKNGQIELLTHKRTALFYFESRMDSCLSSTMKNCKIANIDLVISNPPKCKTVLYLDFLTSTGKILKTDSIVNTSIVKRKYTIDFPLDVIKYRAYQYDSTLNKVFSFFL